MHPTSLVTLNRLAAGVVAAAALASPVLAQGGGTVIMAQPGDRPAGGQVVVRSGGFGGMMGMGREMYDPPVNTADLDRYASILGLTPTQKEEARALLDASMSEFQPVARRVREQMEAIREEFRDTRDPTVWQGIGPIMLEFRRTRAAVEKEFMDDVQLLLSDEQLERWPQVERTHRRERTLGRGLMSGERVDLLRLVDQLELTAAQREAVTPILAQYELDLDRELIKRNEVYDDGEAQAQNVFQDMQAGNLDRVEQMMARGREASQRVRDVNRRYARQIENALEDDKRQVFADAFRRESFPMIYRETYGSRVLTAALRMDDLDQTQRSSIEALQASFERDLGALNARLQAAQEEREETATVMSFMGGGGERNQDLRRQRRDLDTQTVQRVRDLLTEAQRERLPQRNEGMEEGFAQVEFFDGQRRRRGGDDDSPPQRRGGGRDGGRDGEGPPPPRNPR